MKGHFIALDLDYRKGHFIASDLDALKSDRRRREEEVVAGVVDGA
jgi:hypothetical protein